MGRHGDKLADICDQMLPVVELSGMLGAMALVKACNPSAMVSMLAKGSVWVKAAAEIEIRKSTSSMRFIVASLGFALLVYRRGRVFTNIFRRLFSRAWISLPGGRNRA
jgi:hypothetical protein